MMRIDLLTIFPEMFAGPMSESILRIAQERGLAEIRIWNLRDYTTDRHQVTDDYQYGGGAGMVMKPEPWFRAVRALSEGGRPTVILLSPQGRRFDQRTANELTQHPHLILLCGRYKDVDERVRRHLADLELSIGDYVLSGGELAAMVVVDGIVRLLPGVLSDLDSARGDSFQNGLLDHPHYTRPAEFEGLTVPDILCSGNHEAIRRWRRKEALRRTMERRPDLFSLLEKSSEDEKLIRELRYEREGGVSDEPSRSAEA
jgi:tRNA (guanine37-N1)-methyltransferase